MYLRITRGRFDPARYDEIRPVLEDVLAAVQRLPGFQSYYNGIDRTAGTAVAVSAWDSEEHVRFDRAALGDAIPRLQALGMQLEPAEIYEVIVHA